MRALFVLFTFMILTTAEGFLGRLADYDRESCVEMLQETDLSDLWSCFLKGQTSLYFDQEKEWFLREEGWKRAQNVLDLGSGNGAYLSQLAEAFREKSFLGIDKKASFVEEANAQFHRFGLSFVEGDAEIAYTEHQGQFDAILYRLTLQHLSHPKLSLQLAHEYLKKDGYVFIIDSCDSAKISSHEMRSLEEAFRYYNGRTQLGNRRITMEILEDLQDKGSLLGSLYEVVYTSLDVQGNRLEKGIRFESEQDRRRYFNHTLLLLGILKKGYAVPVDLSEAYDELQVYLKDEGSWVSPGTHLLVLKKI